MSSNRFWIAFPGETPYILEALRRHSAMTGETMASITRRAIREHLERNGVLEPDPIGVANRGLNELQDEIERMPQIDIVVRRAIADRLEMVRYEILDLNRGTETA